MAHGNATILWRARGTATGMMTAHTSCAVLGTAAGPLRERADLRGQKPVGFNYYAIGLSWDAMWAAAGLYRSRTRCLGRDLRFGPLTAMRQDQDRALCRFEFCTSQ
jgi:hypothetical protein